MINLVLSASHNSVWQLLAALSRKALAAVDATDYSAITANDGLTPMRLRAFAMAKG